MRWKIAGYLTFFFALPQVILLTWQIADPEMFRSTLRDLDWDVVPKHLRGIIWLQHLKIPQLLAVAAAFLAIPAFFREAEGKSARALWLTYGVLLVVMIALHVGADFALARASEVPTQHSTSVIYHFNPVEELLLAAFLSLPFLHFVILKAIGIRNASRLRRSENGEVNPAEHDH